MWQPFIYKKLCIGAPYFYYPPNLKRLLSGLLCPLLSFMINKQKKMNRKKKTTKQKEAQSPLLTCPPTRRKPKTSINEKKKCCKMFVKVPQLDFSKEVESLFLSALHCKIKKAWPQRVI